MTTDPFLFIDNVYCVHVPNKERHQAVEQQFKQIGLQARVKYVHAQPPPKTFTMSNMRRNSSGEFGVNLSQIKAIVQAIYDGAKTPAFFEDDVVFDDNAKQYLATALTGLPDDWTILYLGGHPRGPIPKNRAEYIGRNLVKIKKHSCADGYIINGRENLKLLYDMWCDAISRDKAMYDFILAEFAYKTEGAYCVYPLVVNQRPGYSTVAEKVEDKSTIIARGWASHLGYDRITKDHLNKTRLWERKTGRKAVQ